jgi:anti-sigma-K factor RskA
MASHDPEYERMHEGVGLHALGALEVSERDAFEHHLRSCAECAAEVRSLRVIAEALPYGIPVIDPPPSLRARVLEAATGRLPSLAAAPLVAAQEKPQPPPLASRGSTFARAAAWLSAAALLVVAVGLGVYARSLQTRILSLELDLRDARARLDRSEQQVAVATRSVQAAEARMAVLTAPDLRQVNLAGQPVAPRATGRAFLSRGRGLMFTASDLPPLRAGRAYQLWVLLTPTNPVSIGMLQVDANGRVAQAFGTQPDMPRPFAVAVTEEPEAGVPAPTGDKYLVGLTQ